MEQGAGFNEFRQRVIKFLGLDAAATTSFCWEVMFDIVEGTEDYEFNFEHLRLTSDFLMSAVLLSVFHNKKVVVLEPTAYYSFQAVKMFQRWKLEAPNLQIGNVGAVSLEGADVIFHHGKRFNCGNTPRGSRTVVQVFPGVDVPEDSRSLGSLVAAANNYYNDD